MSKASQKGLEIHARGDLVMLRAHLETDREHHKRWQTQGEWLLLDAPWARSAKKEDQQAKRKKQANIQVEAGPPRMAVIATLENIPLGWVNRYRGEDRPSIWFVGINICEDDYLNRGYGTEALRLWVDHLFANSEYHKLCLDTWSFNPRMMRVAEKIGFLSEGCQRAMQFWEGEWLDLMHYGMLREEWELKRSTS